MRSIPYFYLTGLLLCLICLPQAVQATHIRAGQITAERDPTSSNPYTYIFTLTIYRDTKGVDQPNATLNFGVDGATQTVPVSRDRSTGQLLGNDIEVLTFTYRYTYPGPNTYKVTFTEENRNAGVVNMTNSDNTAFHIETEFTINPNLGLNNSVVLRNPPIDRATVGQRFCHNPAAFDPDGDSLSFRLVVPFQRLNTPVLAYISPSAVTPLGTPESGSGAPAFTINSITGEICWDAPGPRKRDGGIITGTGPTDYAEYNIAFEVEEWRKREDGTYVKVGTVRRDMQITVLGNPNKRPDLILPKDTCIVAGTDLRAIIRATDPDGHRVSIGSESAIFSANRLVFPTQPPATLNPFATVTQPEYQPTRPNPAQSAFRWQTDCQHVRAQPYAVVFRAEDDPPSTTQPNPNRLTDTKTWLIRVVGPKPTGLRAVASGRSMQLSWDPYRCQNASRSSSGARWAARPT